MSFGWVYGFDVYARRACVHIGEGFGFGRGRGLLLPRNVDDGRKNKVELASALHSAGSATAPAAFTCDFTTTSPWNTRRIREPDSKTSAGRGPLHPHTTAATASLQIWTITYSQTRHRSERHIDAQLPLPGDAASMMVVRHTVRVIRDNGGPEGPTAHGRGPV